MNRSPSLKGQVYECFSLYGRFVNRPYNLFKHPDKPKSEAFSIAYHPPEVPPAKESGG